ncbi:MAG: ammonium transporter [Methylophilaceae bacterium]|nr:ammonium transporter [Methyloradius sp.]
MKQILSIIALVSALGISGLGFAEEAAPAAEAPAASEMAPAAEAPAAAPAEAAAPAAEAPKMDTGSTAWMITATVLVVMMAVPGLALFYGGLVRTKNMLSVAMQVFVAFSLISVLWAVYGYSLAFSEGNNFIGGLSKAFLAGVTPDSLTGVIPEYVFITFQLTFAAITPALIIGGFSERTKFSAVLAFLALWVTFVYIPIAHMVWGGGLLSDAGPLFNGHGAKDFAGGTVVHINAGIAALVGALVIGKRIGYGKEAMPPHNLVSTMVGASLLWVGWFGFNVGSELAVDGVAALVLINTQLATASAVVGWILAEWLFKGKPSMLGAASGAIAGLVAITPACGFIGPMGSIVLGFLASFLSLWAVTKLKNALGYDDSLDVFGVHGLSGILGAIGTGVLMSPDFGGVGYAEGVTLGTQVTTQAIAVGITVAWTGVVSYILFKLVDVVIGLRVSEEVEREGLDTTEHGERAYHY